MSNTKETNDNYTRRDFVRIGAAAGLGAAFGGMVLSNCSAENRPTSMPVDFISPKIDPVRIG
ncbi:MAG: hypothetical protein GY863_13020, partial [bacterium]|nr:hypothetical protein [bacterium]